MVILICGIGILGLFFNILSIFFNYIVTTNNGSEPLFKYLYINPNIIATFLYTLTYSSLITKLYDNKIRILAIIFTILSLGLLYSSNDLIMFIITFITYIIMSISMLSSKAGTTNKYKKYFYITIGIVICLFIINITILQPHYLNRLLNQNNQESVMIQDRLNHSKFIGDSNLTQNFTKESNYSLIYLMESYGKVLGIFIMTIFTLFTIKILFNSKIIEDNLGKYLIVGLGTFILLQFIINTFTVLGILHIGKINSPFISYNDMSIIINMSAIAIIMSIYSRKTLIRYEKIYRL